MADQIYIGDFAKGLKTNPQPFNIDNDAFPYIFNMYIWRRRAKRKRGTKTLARLQRFLPLLTSPLAGLPAPSPVPFDASYTGNLITAYAAAGITYPLSDEPGSQIAPETFEVWFDKGLANETLYIDDGNGGFIKDHGPFGFLSGTVNYITGAFTINFGAVGHPGVGVPVSASFAYFPGLPVLGLEDFVSNTGNSKFPLLIAFDNKYAYQINQLTGTPFFYQVNYYKGTNVEFVWSADDSNQFWSTNYQSAFWATNNKPGLHLVNGTYIAGSGTATITFTFVTPAYHTPPLTAFDNLKIGDKLWFNEWGDPGVTINGLVGTVSLIVNVALGQYQVTFDTVQTVSGTGIAQLLTNSLKLTTNLTTTQDGIRWYDGDPTSGTGLPTGTGLGWVNFAPPLTATVVSINDQTADLYYLVGALAILPFKDRLLFFAPQIQSSSGPVIQKSIQDTVLWSWNGTPYYNSLVPTNETGTETFDPTAYYVDQTGKGGYLPAGIAQPIVTVMTNEDVLLIGFGGAGKKTRFVYTGNDLQPFLFYLINSEMPSCSTFSAVTLDKGGIDIGQYGITITTQQSTSRIDMDIPDAVFTIQANNNGQNRVNAIRDFQREWIYFSYPTGNGAASEGSWKYPSQTFLYNYRDDTWSVFRENYTHHGTFRPATGKTWQTLPFTSWDTWREPWNAGSQQALFPSIIAGTPQGYVIVKSEGTGEAPTGAIFNILDDGLGNTQIQSINHCVNTSDVGPGGLGDYLSFGGTSIGLVKRTIDADNFVIDIPFPSTANITNATQATHAVLTLSWPIPVDPPTINSYFPGQRVSIAGVVGMIELNGNTYQIISVTPTSITLDVDSTLFTPYISGGTTTLVDFVGPSVFTKLSQPLLQSKQFPFYWQQGRQVRLGSQKYLLDTTQNSQVTVDISLSQDPENDWNDSPIIPANDVTNESLVYSQVLYTCPESTNIGLTPSNTNLQTLVGAPQQQIWHRMNTSLQGDTFQVGITLSDVQMRNLQYATDEIALHGIQFTVYPGAQLS